MRAFVASTSRAWTTRRRSATATRAATRSARTASHASIASHWAGDVGRRLPTANGMAVRSRVSTMLETNVRASEPMPSPPTDDQRPVDADAAES